MILVHFHQNMRVEVSGLEDLIGWGVYILVEQKAWGTFAFLFGVGFAVLLRRLEARQAPVVVIYLRRLAGLAVFGVIAEVGFGFQILFAYAFWGLPLLLIRNWSTPALLAAAAVSAAAQPLTAAVRAILAWQAGVPLPPARASGLWEAVRAAEAHGSYLEVLAARWALFAHAQVDWQSYLPDTNLALFIIGLLAVRHGVLDRPRDHVRLIAGWMTFGGVSWLLSWTVANRLPELPIQGLGWPLASGLGLIRDQWLCFTYIGIVILTLAWRPVWTTRLAPFGQAGRMALTNYMLQVVVLDFLASGYGLALRLRPAFYVVATVLLFALEALFAAGWLARFRYGPLEWLWRTLTYWRRQPLRREPQPAGGPNRF